VQDSATTTHGAVSGASTRTAITDDMQDLPDYQRAYARPASEVSDWGDPSIDLLTAVKKVKPTSRIEVMPGDAIP